MTGKSDDVFEAWDAHERRIQKLTATLARLNTSVRDTEIALNAERLIGEQLANQRKRFGLLRHLFTLRMPSGWCSIRSASRLIAGRSSISQMTHLGARIRLG